MNSPAKVILREWQKPETVFEVYGWRPEKSLAFGFDGKGQSQVLEFVLPPQVNEHDRPTPAFPQHPPTDVTEIRLVPPPCRADQAGAHTLRVRAKANTDAAGTVFPSANWDPSRWELVRLSYDQEILILKPEDDGPLAELLNKFKEEKRQEYAARKQELHMLLELVHSRQPISGRAHYYAHIVSNSHEAPSADSAAAWRLFLDQARIKLDMDFGQGGYKSGFLWWTREDARRHPDIRDPYLQSRWAKEHGLDLQEMAGQRKQIAAWTGMVDPGNFVLNIFKDALGEDFSRRQFPTAPSPSTLKMAEADDLEFGASIRFRVTFDGKVQAWLTDCRRRDAHLSERTEFGAAQGKIVTLETIKGGLDSVEKKTDQVLTGVQTLTELAGQRTADDVGHVSATLSAAEALTKAGQRARADAEGGVAKLAAVGDHLTTKVQGAAQTLRQAQKELQPTLDDLETNQARLEAVVEEYKLKESPVQTRRALANHGVAKRIIDFILEHLISGKAVPRAPTAARQLQNKFATKDGLDRRTVDRHFRNALPILRAAGWSERLLPAPKAADVSCAGEAGPKPHDEKQTEAPVGVDELAKRDSSDTLSAIERIQQQESGSEDRDD